MATQALAALAHGLDRMVALLAASGEGDTDVVGGVTAQTVPTPARLQLLQPAVAWDWPTDPNGTSSAELYEFCSWMPASSGPGQPYEASTNRFSDGYRMFLSCLQPDVLTSAALAAFADSRYTTLVMYAQEPQSPMPAWSVSQFPQAWLASVSGDPSTAGTIHVPLPTAPEPLTAAPHSTCFGLTAADGTDTPVPLDASPGQYVDIHADAWGLITVRPAGWYDGALVGVKAAGPYTTASADAFFGPDGVLRNLLTGLCVALNPTVTASVSGQAATTLAARPASSGLRVGGLVFDDITVSAPAPGGAALVTASGLGTSTPIMVGATVAALGRST